MEMVLVFDMDGTLIDTDEIIYQTWNELFTLFKPKGISVSREETKNFSGPPVEQSIAKAFPEADGTFILKEYRNRTTKYYDNFLRLFPGELEVLNKLHNEGYKMCIATTKNREMAIKCLEKYKIKDYFDIILTSSDGLKNKPAPDMLNYISKKMNIAKENMIMIGDTKFDYHSSKNANVDCILFNGASRHYEDDIKPFAIVNTYDELYKVIKNK